MPVDDRVAAIFRPTSPDFPMPQTTKCPSCSRMSEAAASSAPSKPCSNLAIAVWYVDKRVLADAIEISLVMTKVLSSLRAKSEIYLFLEWA